MISRRTFLAQSSLIALAPTIPTFLARCALASRPEKDARVLVIIELDGGNDGINTIVPYADPGYEKNRRQLRLPSREVLKINDQVAFHPAMRAAKALLDDGRLAVVQGVGYPNPNRSHFRSRAIWHSARFELDQHDDCGWAGLALDAHPLGAGADAIAIGPEELPLAIRGRRSVASALLHKELSRATLSSPIMPQGVLEPAAMGEDLDSFVQRIVLNAYTTADAIAAAVSQSKASPPYPATDLAARLQVVAQLVKANMGSRIYYARLPGFDTHSTQLPAHARLLTEFSEAVKALLDDLAAAKLAERVVVMAFSEFGRRVEENNSLGTDHGTAGPVFFAGARIRGGIHGRVPSLVDLEDGDLKWNVDFRQVYASVLRDWLGIDPEAALGGRFEELSLFS